MPMTVLVKSKTDLMVPASVRRRAGFKAGDRLEFKVSGGIVTIVPKVPTADDEDTEEQREIIDARLDKAERGPVHGPFDTAEETIAHMKAELRKRAAVKKPRRGR
jgi:AbrB family looped-hinge helix DNA binding protein